MLHDKLHILSREIFGMLMVSYIDEMLMQNLATLYPAHKVINCCM